MKAMILDMCILSHKTVLVDVRTRGGRRRGQERGFSRMYTIYLYHIQPGIPGISSFTNLFSTLINAILHTYPAGFGHRLHDWFGFFGHLFRFYSDLFPSLPAFFASRPMFLLVLSREWMGLGEWNDY